MGKKTETTVVSVSAAVGILASHLTVCLTVSSADNLCIYVLDLDQARRFVRPDQDPKCFALWW